MLPDLPHHLQDLVDQVPEDYEYSKHVFLRRDKLLVKKAEHGEEQTEDRPYRYWLTRTGEEVEVEYHTISAKTGILTGTCDTWENPMILGRDPIRPQKHFKSWRGVKYDFGVADDDRYLVIKDLGQPDWVDDVLKGIAYDESIRGKGPVRQSYLAPDGDEDQTDQDFLSHPSTRSTRMHQTRPTSVPKRRLNGQDHNVSSDEEPARGAALQTRTRVQSIERGSGNSFRNTPATQAIPVNANESGTDTKNNEASMIERPDNGTVSIPPTLAVNSTRLDNLLVHFKNSTDFEVHPRRRALCNSPKKLFSQALARGVLSSSQDTNALLVTVKGGVGGSNKVSRMAEGDEDDFNELHSAVVQTVADSGLRDTFVEVSRI